MSAKRSRSLVAVAIIIALLGLFRFSQTEAFSVMRNVDIVTLLGSGMAFGVAFTTAVRQLSK